jgi:stage II sporulation protein R
MRKTISFILAILLGTIIFAGCDSQSAQSIPLRLHVIANSNSQADQAVKLEVRDNLLQNTGEAMEGMQSMQQAEAYMQAHMNEITESANQVLKKNGFEYKAIVNIGESYFPDKQYGDTVYPAGNYQAVKIVLGEGKGDNWWCVLFPPLCIVAMNGPKSAYTDKGTDDGSTNLKKKILFKSIFGESF